MGIGFFDAAEPTHPTGSVVPPPQAQAELGEVARRLDTRECVARRRWFGHVLDAAEFVYRHVSR